MIGRLDAIARFPVKSMLGESLQRAVLEESGVVGDRALALIETATGKVVSAKDPRRWRALLDFRAAYDGDAGPGAAVSITFPDGSVARVGDADLNARLSRLVGDDVSVVSVPAAGAAYDAVWDVAGVLPDELVASATTGVTDQGDPVTTMPIGLMAPGTFQDLAPVTVMTTASLERMAELAPDSSWDPARFRSNLLIEVDATGFVEDAWMGQRLTTGDVVLEVVMAAPRCVMTTLSQHDLPADRGVLQGIATHHRIDLGGGSYYACLGVYASVVSGGEVAVGEPIELA